MSLKCCCCCRSNTDGESVSDKSWTAGTVNTNFETAETSQPQATTNQTAAGSETPNNNTLRRKSIVSEGDGPALSKIDLNLNLFENDRFTDMAATIHKSQMHLDHI